MANKTILGVDIGYDQLKLALVNGERVLRTASAAMPKNLIKEGRITSEEVMADLIRQVMKDNHMKANVAAYVLPNEMVYVKNVKLPLMTIDQLVYNLPFEFNDYITGEVQDYVFDYAVLSRSDLEDKPVIENMEGEEDQEINMGEMELMAVGVQRETVEEAASVLRKAGLKMTVAAPTLSAYISLIRARKEFLSKTTDEFGILDLGYESIRMYMYKKDRHMATRVLEIGLSSLDGVLADAFGVDSHLAHTYLMSNFENCQEREECLTAYENIAIELMRALNFYRFSNPDSALSDLWLCGGGALIRPLTEAIDEMLDMEMHSGAELVPGGKKIPDCSSYVQAIGITFQ